MTAKVFNYSNQSKGWCVFDTIKQAREFAASTLSDYFYQDRDSSYTYFVEIYHDGDFEVWVGEFGSWSGCRPDDEPYKDIYCVDREVAICYNGFRPTTKDPWRDYIIV